MKKIFSLLLCFCFFILLAGTVSAQEQQELTPKSEWKWSDRVNTLSLTVGFPSFIAVLETEGEGCFGAYSIRYEHNVLKWLAVSLRCQYEGWRDYYDERIHSTDDSDYETTHRIDLSLGVNFTYVNREHVQVYSGLGFGVADVIENNLPWMGFACYLTPVGLRIGSKRLYGMAEVNVGTASVLCCGLCVKF